MKYILLLLTMCLAISCTEMKPKRKFKVIQYYEANSWVSTENFYCDSVKVFSKYQVRAYLDGIGTDLISERIVIANND